MGLTFIFGASGSGKSTYIRNKVITEADGNRKKTYLYIVPDQFTMQTQMDMTLANSLINNKKGILNVDVLSFGRLTHRIFEEVGEPSEIPLDDTGKCLIIRRIIGKRKNELPCFCKAVGNPGYVQEIKSVISEFMQYGIKPEDLDYLMDYSATKPALKMKLKDFKTVYTAFLQEIKNKYTTGEDSLEILCRKIPTSKLIKKSVIVFDGFTGFTPVQICVIRTLLENAIEVYITLPFEPGVSAFREDSADYLFNMTQHTVKVLQKIAEGEGINVKVEGEELLNRPPYRFNNNPSLLHLEKNILRNNSVPYSEECSDIEIIRATGIREECKLACEKMFELINERGYKYRDVAIVCSDLSTYEKEMSMCLKEYDVPYFIDSTRSLLENPFIEMIKSALNVVVYNYRYGDVFAFLKSGFTDLSKEEIDFFENYCLARGIERDYRFKTKFTVKTSETGDDPANLDALNGIREKLVDIFSTFDGLKRNSVLPAKEWMVKIYNFLISLNCEDKLFSKADAFMEEGLTVYAKEYEQIYKIVMGLFDQVCNLLGEEEITLEEIKNILEAGFAELRVGTIPLGVDTLVVGDMERTRIKEVKALFFLGVNEGKIPAVGTGGGIISATEREFLENSELEFAPSVVKEMYIQRLYLYLNLTKPSEYLYLSFASIDEGGKSLSPSFLVEEIQTLFPGLKVLNKSAHKPVISTNDALEYLAGMLRELVISSLPEDEGEKLISLYGSLLATQEGRVLLPKIRESAFREYVPENLPEEILKELFGDKLNISVSSLENFAKCQYMYFLGYALRISDRERFGVENVDIGNMVHSCLEKYALAVSARGRKIEEMTEEENRAIIEELISNEAENYSEALFTESSENKYMVKLITGMLRTSIRTMQKHLSAGQFTPTFFEEKFRRELTTEKGRNVELKGKIDRIDLASQSDDLFVKIIDYKTSTHDFDEAQAEMGAQLQLSVYLKEACAKMQEKYPGKNILPAAMFYYKVFKPVLKNSGELTEGELAKMIMESMNNTGVMTSNPDVAALIDATTENGASLVAPVKFAAGAPKGSKSVVSPEELKAIMDDAEKMSLTLADKIIDGEISVAPLKIKTSVACEYCPFTDVCRFDRKIHGYRFREEEKQE